jgi:hypothetical protein
MLCTGSKIPNEWFCASNDKCWTDAWQIDHSGLWQRERSWLTTFHFLFFFLNNINIWNDLISFVCLATVSSTPERITCPHENLMKALRKDDRILIYDGAMEIKVNSSYPFVRESFQMKIYWIWNVIDTNFRL